MNGLNGFLASFGRTLESVPEVWVAFNNYYQDIGVGGSRLGNLTLLNGVRMFPPNEPNKDYPDFRFGWYINGVLRSEKGNPTLADLKGDCDGVVKIRLEVLHLPTQSLSIREEWGYLDYLDLPSCEAVEGSPSQFGVFYDFYGGYEQEPRRFMRLVHDYNGYGVVNAGDLILFLQGVGGK
jgi:hypothetical protein